MIKRLMHRFSSRVSTEENVRKSGYFERAPLLTLILSDAANANQPLWGVTTGRDLRRG